MGREDAILVLEAPIGSALYAQALALREAVLRQPLGLTLSGEELEDDKLRTHFCAVEAGDVVACVWLKPVSDGSLQLKQMAVKEERRLEGHRGRVGRSSRGLGARPGHQRDDDACADRGRRLLCPARL